MQDFVCNKKYISDNQFVNIYNYFSNEIVWPRGYPLDEIHNSANYHVENSRPVEVGVWQGLADNDPDVDAIFRLTINRKVKFDAKPPIVFEKGTYCPFNSQNTFWNKKAFPYLYLPATTSFRFTDILRGYIAQRLLWENNLHLGFTKATVYQKRNTHDLMRDFRDEIECYLNVRPIVELLDSLEFGPEPMSNIEDAYRILAEQKYVKSEELIIVEAWINDLRKIMGIA